VHGTRYSGICGTNGIREEMISPDNMKNFLTTLIYNFKKNAGALPNRIFYFRDGVSEQQYHHVLQEEVTLMKKVCNGLNAAWQPKFTVTVCSKRHHHRFFPGNRNDGDKNGNCKPGTIIERDITDPAEYDFCKSFNWDYDMNITNNGLQTSIPTKQSKEQPAQHITM